MMKLSPSAAMKMSAALRRPSSQPSSNEPLPRRHAPSATMSEMPKPKQLNRKISSCKIPPVSPPKTPPPEDGALNSSTSTPSTPVKSGARISAGVRKKSGIACRYMRLEPRARERGTAAAGALLRHRFDDTENRASHALVVAGEYLHDFLV